MAEHECTCTNCGGRERCKIKFEPSRKCCCFWKPELKPIWIPCSERLPEIGTDVLIFFPYWKDNPIQVASLMSDGLGWDICGEFNPAMARVTHWMPLPDFPKEVDENG